MIEARAGAYRDNETGEIVPVPDGYGIQFEISGDYVSAGGVFFDTKTHRVVDTVPEEGVQLAAPGSVVTDAVRAEIDAYKAIEALAHPAPVARGKKA